MFDNTAPPLLTTLLSEYHSISFHTSAKDPDTNLVAVKESLLDLISLHISTLTEEELLKVQQMEAASLEIEEMILARQKIIDDKKPEGILFAPDFNSKKDPLN